MRKLSMEELGRKSIADFKTAEKLPVVVVLDNIRSMHNVGSTFRTADGFAIEKIILCGYTPRPPHRDIQKTALGATETVTWEYAENVVEAVQKLKDEGCIVYGVEQTEGSVSLEAAGSLMEQGRLALIFGNEVEGVSEDALALCDGAIEIPQFGTKHSLNISVAAGIVLWEFARLQFTQANS